RRRDVGRPGEVGPQLEAVHPAVRVALGHFLMEDAAASGHPLHVTHRHPALVAQAIAVLHRAGEHVRDRLDATVRMPREAGEVIARVLVPEIVEQQEGIEVLGLAEPKGALKLHARAFERRLGLEYLLDGAERHRILATRCSPKNSRGPGWFPRATPRPPA